MARRPGSSYELCPKCRGEGIIPCEECGGKGTIEWVDAILNEVHPCPVCKRKRQVPCPFPGCKGQGYIPRL